VNNLGVLYDNGGGVDQDSTQARKCYQGAADAGDSDAMYNLGTLFEEQLRDFGKACAWYRKADDTNRRGR
jgi:uncharacterized protein